MAETDILKQALKSLAGIEEDDFQQSLPYWQYKEYKKGEYYNEYRNVCKHLGFIIDGVFRTYYVDTKSEKEKNVFFYSKTRLLFLLKALLTRPLVIIIHNRCCRPKSFIYILII